jgi:hypothetical protein
MRKLNTRRDDYDYATEWLSGGGGWEEEQSRPRIPGRLFGEVAARRQGRFLRLWEDTCSLGFLLAQVQSLTKTSWHAYYIVVSHFAAPVSGTTVVLVCVRALLCLLLVTRVLAAIRVRESLWFFSILGLRLMVLLSPTPSDDIATNLLCTCTPHGVHRELSTGWIAAECK